MQISVQRDTYRGHSRSPWLVVVPRRISSTGQRLYRRFSTRADAAKFAAQLRTQVKEHGEHPLPVLTGEAAEDAQAAAKILEGSGLTLGQAAQLVAQLLQRHGSVATILSIGGEGVRGSDTAEPAGPRPQTPTADAITVHAAIEALAAAKAYQAASTVANRAARFNTLLRRNPGLARVPLASLTAGQVETALSRAWPAAGASWNDCHKHLSALFSHAVRKGWVAASPMAAIDLRHVEEAEIRPLMPADLRALFAACRPPTEEERTAAAAADAYTRRLLLQDTRPLAAYVALCAFAGIRPAECARLRWHDVNTEEGVVSVRSAQAKTGGTRHVELHPTLAAWLSATRPAGVEGDALIIPPTQLKWRTRAMRLRAGYNDTTRPWQDDVLRHSYATWYLKAGGQLHQLQLNMGHSSTRLLYTRYTNMVGTTRAAAAEWWSITPTS